MEDYPCHKEARALLDSLNRWLVPIIVVYELAWLAERLGMGRGVVKAVLEHGKTRVVCDRGEISSAALESGDDFNDSVVLETAAFLGKPLATFDRELRARAKRRRLEVLPP